ncbi:MAG: hypothetical protein N2381_06385 [Armatimonadetes bacterium]|nr:hypothetical protein [Armatimonadota bacterium]
MDKKSLSERLSRFHPPLRKIGKPVSLPSEMREKPWRKIGRAKLLPSQKALPTTFEKISLTGRIERRQSNCSTL